MWKKIIFYKIFIVFIKKCFLNTKSLTLKNIFCLLAFLAFCC